MHSDSCFACSTSKLQFIPAVDNRGYPIKGSCDLEDVGLVSVFDSLANPQPGTPFQAMLVLE